MSRDASHLEPADLSPALRAVLEQIARNGPAGLATRAKIVLARANGLPLKSIASAVGLHRDSVRRWIRRFAARGLAGLQHGNSGRPRNVTFDPRVCDEICSRATQSPASLGEPFDLWSLSKLRSHLIRRGIVRTISVERLRQLLDAGDCSRHHWLNRSARGRPRTATPTRPAGVTLRWPTPRNEFTVGALPETAPVAARHAAKPHRSARQRIGTGVGSR
ncbi:MAG TPA: helix-turn-helix domain-containing protein [Candidatus Binatia bacterium]|nr:helix-turn-helix domain-containing protein [Candidatus Binatia bacterium]